MSDRSDGGEREIFEAALERSGDEREAFLGSACGSPELLQRVRRLLDAHRRLEESATRRLPEQLKGLAEATAPAPERIGLYRILQRIGEGGMGVVYVAEQVEPVRRKVALKLVKAGMDTREVIARFHSERQALALMNHPNIARILEAGATEEGRPYFVMEYVPGMPLLDYCDQQRLDLRQRLGLFIDVCQAVQHAHQKGVIHRDLKPSNVLIHEEDGRPVPKVIDFGVAKAMTQPLSDLTVHTRLGGFIGTPAYVSPEQARMTGLDVDTRADVYSLGAMLYELLTGVRALDLSDPSLSFHDVQNAILEHEPPPPSQCFEDPETAAPRAEARRSDPSTLRRALRHDLDWIVTKAIEKDRSWRYASASELAADVARYLEDSPVTAGPHSLGYRMGRFARRHRAVLVLIGLVMLALIGGVTGTTWGLLNARKEAARAQTQTAIAEEINAFLNQDLLAAVTPSRQGIDVSMREVLDQAAERIEGKFSQQPMVEASLRQTIGETYRHLGIYDAAAPHLELAVRLLHAERGEEHPDSMRAQSELGTLYRRQARFEAAEPLLTRALDAQRRVLGASHPATLETLGSLARLYQETERYDDAEAAYLESMAAWQERLGARHPEILAVQEDLATLYQLQGRLEEAERLQLAALEGQRDAFGAEHSTTLNAAMNLATIYTRMERYEDAERLLLDHMEPMRRVMGEEHPRSWMMLHNLGHLYFRQQRLAEAEPLLQQALEAKRQGLGEEHPSTERTRVTLLAVYRALGDAQGLRAMATVYLEDRRRAALAPGAKARDKNAYAWQLLVIEPADLRDAEAALAVALDANAQSGNADPLILDTLAHAYWQNGQIQQALATAKRALAAADRQPPAIRQAIARTVEDLAAES
ncbi:MAG: serine/threonine-protein kinase [Acidobacteriota bacterium]